MQQPRVDFDLEPVGANSADVLILHQPLGRIEADQQIAQPVSVNSSHEVDPLADAVFDVGFDRIGAFLASVRVGLARESVVEEQLKRARIPKPPPIEKFVRPFTGRLIDQRGPRRNQRLAIARNVHARTQVEPPVIIQAPLVLSKHGERPVAAVDAEIRRGGRRKDLGVR